MGRERKLRPICGPGLTVGPGIHSCLLGHGRGESAGLVARELKRNFEGFFQQSVAFQWVGVPPSFKLSPSNPLMPWKVQSYPLSSGSSSSFDQRADDYGRLLVSRSSPHHAPGSGEASIDLTKESAASDCRTQIVS